ncbi:MAG: DUF523 domain-containing protein [Asgard group archaeon]|nr:DUF523 domain-containing protein [Asgard group archaeon]
MSGKKLEKIKSKFADERSKEILFVSHCLLNENTRYFGGAFQKNFSEDLVEQIHEKGFGIIQLPCPEQLAWGGIQKPLLWFGVDNRKTIIYPFRHLIYRLFIIHTKRIFSKITRQIIKQIKENQKSGYIVQGIVGVGGSPTCGVYSSIDISRIDDFAHLSIDKLDRTKLNELFYSKFLQEGPGLFIKILKRKLLKKKINISFFEFDLKKEMVGQKQKLF